MPIKIPDNLPARDILSNENIFIMGDQRALQQDIRPLQIAILNLMPTKIATETQILRLLSNTALQVEITLVRTGTHVSRNTSADHLATFYTTFPDIQDRRFDGFIITGAPVEHLAFEEVDYWPELVSIMDWTRTNVYSTFFICWGAQAGLYHRYGINKYPLPAKMFGVFEHTLSARNVPLLRGFDDVFLAPHSRHTEIRREEILAVPELQLLSESNTAGVYLLMSRDGRQIYVTGHSEYDPLTLKSEYDRDVSQGKPITIPVNYYPDDDPTKAPLVRWRGHSNLLFSNWLNYYVYQETPYDLKLLDHV